MNLLTSLKIISYLIKYQLITLNYFLILRFIDLTDIRLILWIGFTISFAESLRVIRFGIETPTASAMMMNVALVPLLMVSAKI